MIISPIIRSPLKRGGISWSSYWTTHNNLTLTIAATGVKLDWVDSSDLVATEIWAQSDGGVSALIATVAAGTKTYTDALNAVDLRYYKIRGLKNGEYTAFTTEQSIGMLSDELMPDVSVWAASGLAWWNTKDACWSGDGTKLTSSGGSGFLNKQTFWVVGKKYRIIVTATRAAGTCYASYDGSAPSVTVVTTGTQTVYYTTGNAINYTYSDSFNGTITNISIKQVLVPTTIMTESNNGLTTELNDAIITE